MFDKVKPKKGLKMHKNVSEEDSLKNDNHCMSK